MNELYIFLLELLNNPSSHHTALFSLSKQAPASSSWADFSSSTHLYMCPTPLLPWEDILRRKCWGSDEDIMQEDEMWMTYQGIKHAASASCCLDNLGQIASGSEAGELGLVHGISKKF